MNMACALCVLAAVPVLSDYRPDRDGAATTVGLSVVDMAGKPIPGAKAMFRVFTTLDKCYKVVRDTDEDGYCEISGKTRGEVTVVVTKEGYYTSYGALEYRDLKWEESVREHKWTHGIVKSRISMKPVLNPQKHVCGGLLMKRPPALNSPLPFDVFQRDWCAPFGKGTVPDFLITCYETTNAVGRSVRGMRIRAGHCADGFVLRRIDQWSKFKYDLNADECAKFSKEIRQGTVLGENGKPECAEEFTPGNYLIFRVRTQTNEVGRIVKANYGTIGESLDFQGDLTLNAHVNPKVNDTSLEYDWAYRNMKKGR